MQLRSYQQDALQQIDFAFAAGSRAVLYQLPTGAGKTVIFSSAIN
jgi:superfamily II DNA or RNA helicase